MPFLELKCKECGYEFEAYCATTSTRPTCPKCSAKTEQIYSGKMWTNCSNKKVGCSGNCATCKGCK